MRRTRRHLLGAISACLMFGLMPACVDGAFPIRPAPAINVQLGTAIKPMVPGTSQSITVTANFIGGPVAANMGYSGLPAGFSVKFAPTLIYPDYGEFSGTTVMTITADSTVTGAAFTFEIVAAEYRTDFKVSGRLPVFGLIEEPFSLTVGGPSSATAGNTVTLPILATRKAGFTGTIALSVDPSTVPILTRSSFEPTVLSGIAEASTARLDLDPGAQPAIYLVKVTGTYGSTRVSSIHAVNVILAPAPPEITLVAAPASVTVVPGQSATYNLAVTRSLGTLGFGQFVLSASGLPEGATLAFTPAVPQDAAQLVIATAAATNDGTYPIAITATLGTLVKTSSVNLVVATPANFTLTLAQTAVTVNRGANIDVAATFQRTGPKSDIILDIDPQSIPKGVSVTPSPAVVNSSTTSSKIAVVVAANAVAGTHQIIVRGVSGAVSKTATLTLTIPTPPPGDVTISVLTPIVSVVSGGTTQIPIKLTRKGPAVGQLLELRSTGIPAGGSAWITPSSTTADSATLNVIAGTAGEFDLAVSALIGALPPTDIASIKVTASGAGDFSLLPAPQTLETPIGSPTTAALQIGRTNGFTGPVSFVAIAENSTDYQVTFSLNSTTGNGIGMTVNVGPNVAVGPHVLRIRGTSGNIVHEVSMTLIVTNVYNPYPYYPYGVKRPPPN